LLKGIRDVSGSAGRGIKSEKQDQAGPPSSLQTGGGGLETISIISRQNHSEILEKGSRVVLIVD